MNKPCPQCQTTMQPVYRATEDMRLRGWYCAACRFFDKAVGRERQFRRESNE